MAVFNRRGRRGQLADGALAEQGRLVDSEEGAQAKGRSRAKMFFSSAVPDYILVLIVSTALVFTVSYGFESAPDLRANVWVCAGLCVPMLVILFAGSWSKRALVPSAIAAVVYAIVVLAAFAAQIPEGVDLIADGQVNDVAENPVVFGVVALVVPVAVYLLSRRRLGAVVLLAGCALACGFIQFLYRDWSTAQPGTLAALIAIATCTMLFVFQGYRSAVYGVKRVTKTAFGGAAGFACVIAVACFFIAGVAYYAIVEPLGLSTYELKPIEQLYQKPTEEFTSLYEMQEVDNPDVLTSQTNDQTRDTQDDAEGGDEGETSEDQQDWSGNPITALIRNTLSFDPDDWNQTFQAIGYQTIMLWVLATVLALALIVLLIMAWQRWRRNRRLVKLRGQSQAYGIWYLYTFLTQRLERLGFVKPDTFTPLEFAMASRGAMAPFTRNTGGVDYLQLTLIYQRACYAPETLTDGDEADIVRYYRAFFDNARRFVGTRRWLWKFWWI